MKIIFSIQSISFQEKDSNNQLKLWDVTENINMSTRQAALT